MNLSTLITDNILSHQGSALPLEAYKLSAVSDDDLEGALAPPVGPSAAWLPNSCICLTWEPPVLVDGKNRGIAVAGYKVNNPEG